jgi:hypothetical protein
MAKWQEIENDLKRSLRSGDQNRVSVLRMLMAALNSQKHAAGRAAGQELGKDEALSAIKSEIKKRRDAIAAYKDAGRPELAEKETKELAVLEEYLPEQMLEDDLRKLVREVISETGAEDKSAFGRVMGQVMARAKGQADGALVKRMVEEELAK